MKNVNAYNDAIMVGRNWVATPFVLNYGVSTIGYEDAYIEFDEDYQCNVNYFDMEKPEYKRYMRRVAKPKYYGMSFRCGDMGYAKYGASNKQNNVIQLLFDNAQLKIASIWLDKDVIPKTKDYTLIGLVKFDKEKYDKMINCPVLLTCDVMLFKYTMEMFEDLLYLRFDKDFGKSYQYSGLIRFDSGIDEDTGFIESFSVAKCCMSLEPEFALSCINKIKLLKHLDLYE